MFFEKVAEIVLIFKAAGVGDLLDRKSCFGKQLLGFLQSKSCDVFRGGYARVLLETANELHIR